MISPSHPMQCMFSSLYENTQIHRLLTQTVCTLFPICTLTQYSLPHSSEAFLPTHTLICCEKPPSFPTGIFNTGLLWKEGVTTKPGTLCCWFYVRSSSTASHVQEMHNLYCNKIIGHVSLKLFRKLLYFAFWKQVNNSKQCKGVHSLSFKGFYIKLLICWYFTAFFLQQEKVNNTLSRSKFIEKCNDWLFTSIMIEYIVPLSMFLHHGMK